MEFVFGSLVVLAVVALVGHGLWLAVRATFRGLASLVGGKAPRREPAEMCPRCGDPWHRRHGQWRCLLCGWTGHEGDDELARPRPDLALARLRYRADRYAQIGLISAAIRDRLVRAIQAEEALAAPAPAVAPVSAPPRPAAASAATTEAIHARPATAGSIEFLEAGPPTPGEPALAVARVAPVADLPERARAYRESRDAGQHAAATSEAVAAEPLAQRFFRLLSAFLEEKSIRWGELVGGLLIVGCSLALVISFWSSIAERPVLKYVLFNGVTATLFGLGFHAERRWKLPTTALGLLIIATLLTPLNFLAVASLVRKGGADSAWILGGELVAVGAFAALVLRAGRSLVAAAPWTLLIGVVLPSASMLLVRRMGDSGALTLALAGLPWAAHLAATVGRMARSREEPEIREASAAEIFRLLGLASFAATLALGLVLAHAGPVAEAAHRLTPLAPLAGASILAPGLLLWRRVAARDLIGYRTAGAAVAAAGTLILLAGVALAWPAPARMLPVALLDFATLTALAVVFRVPATHVLAGACLALAYLVGWAATAGRLGWQGDSSAQAVGVLLSSGCGVALVPLVLSFGAAAAALMRAGRRADAKAYSLVSSLAGLASLGLVTWYGFGREGDPGGVTPVYVVYAVATIGLASAFARRPLIEGSSGALETRVLGWLASGLFLAALVQGLAFGGFSFHPPLPGIVALLAHATVMGTAGLWAMFRPPVKEQGDEAFDPVAGKPSPGRGILLEVFDRSALLATFAAASGLAFAIVVPGSAASLAAYGLWLSALWMILARRHASPALFAAGQAAQAGAVVFAVAAALGREGWYASSPLPWLDPWTIQCQGLALGGLCLVWIAARLAFRAAAGRWPKLLPEAGRLLDPPWPAFDRYVRGVVVGMAIALAVYAALPGVLQEMTPGNVAAQIRGIAPTGRVVPPIAAFEIAGVPHAHALGVGSWALGGIAIATLLAGRWERARRLDLTAALAVAMMAAPLVAGRWEASVAAASALRWAGAIALLAASALIWGRGRLDGLARRLGRRSDEGWAAGLRRPAVGTVLVLGLVPLGAMTAFAVASALEGHPIVGPDPESFFRRIGDAASYATPVLLAAATLVGFAVRERSSGFAFASGMAFNAAATVAYLMGVAGDGAALDASHWVILAQINAIVASVSALAWVGTISSARRRRGEPGPAPADGLLAASVALGVVLNLLLLVAGSSSLFLEPVPTSAHRAIAGPLGYVALALSAAAVVAWSRSRGRPVAAGWHGLSLLGLVAIFALGLSHRDSGDWLAYHGLLGGLAAAGLALPWLAWQRAGLRISAVAEDVRTAAGRWSAFALGVVVLFSIRAYWSDPQTPWWTVGGLASMGVLAAVLACWTARPGFLRLSCVLFNVAATAWWCAGPWWTLSRGGLTSLVDLVNVNVIALALPAPIWLWIERGELRPARARWVPFQSVAAWLALGVMALVAVIGLGDDAVGGVGGSSPLLGWLAIGATAVALGCGLWDRAARAPIAGLYLLGLCGSGWALVQFHLPSRWLAWTGMMVLAAYSVGTSYLWCRRATLRGLADRAGMARPDADDPNASLSWLVPANLTLAAGVLALAFSTILADPRLPMRSAAAHAALAEALAVGLLARGARRSRLQAITLGVGVVGAVAWGWAWVEPGSPTGMLDRLAVVLASAAGGAALYGLGLSKLVRRAGDWTLAARRLVPALLGLSAASLAATLGVELFERSGGHAIPMAAPAVAAVALSLVGAAAAALAAAVVPGRDPLGLTERGRTAYVYGCEVLIVALGAHARLTLPWLFSGLFAQYWPLILLGVAFVGVGLGELFRRQGRLVLAEPLERTGALLPVFPLLAAFWAVPRPGEDVVFLALVGTLYTTLSLLRSSAGFGALAALAGNAALWSWLGHRDGLGLMQHPQIWVIPPALCVLAGAYLNRDRLAPSQMAAIRTAASLAIYVASTADVVLTGVARAPWLPAVLAALSIAGIFAGILLRVRGFLFSGLGFLCLSVFSVIWYAAVDLRQTWLWAASGVVAGVAILAVFALFEKKRQDVLRVVDRLREWEA